MLILLLLCATFEGTLSQGVMRKVTAGLFCKKPFTSCVRVNDNYKIPTPKNGQVLIKMSSSSVNPSDVDTVEMGGCLLGCGNDMAGVVFGCNSCNRLKVGDLVWGFANPSFADYVTVTEDQVSLRPTNVPTNQAGTIPEVGLTSLFSLKRTNIDISLPLPFGSPWSNRSNVTVVITAGSGGTGFIGIEIAIAYGATNIITSTTGAAAIAFVRSLGATQVFDYKKEDLFTSLPDNSVDFVYDNYAEEGTADKALRTIRPGGTYLMMPHGECYTKKTQGPPCLSSKTKKGVRQINYVTSVDFQKYVLDGLKELTSMFDKNQLKAHVARTFNIDNISSAFNFSAGSGEGGVNNNHFGKIAIVMDK